MDLTVMLNAKIASAGWPNTCFLSGCPRSGKKRWGKRFQVQPGGGESGNPRDPLIGFPGEFIANNPETKNRKLTTKNWFSISFPTNCLLKSP